jgi:hypothetical protein
VGSVDPQWVVWVGTNVAKLKISRCGNLFEGAVVNNIRSYPWLWFLVVNQCAAWLLVLFVGNE